MIFTLISCTRKTILACNTRKSALTAEKEIRSEDIVKGFEYDKGKYVVITDEEIEKIKTEKEKAIQILHFAQLNRFHLFITTRPSRRHLRQVVRRPLSCLLGADGRAENSHR